MSYLFTLSNGTPLVHIDSLMGNGVGHCSSCLQIIDIISNDDKFAASVISGRPDCFIVLGDVRSQYRQGQTFTVVDDTKYSGTYTVMLSGSKPGDSVSSFVDGNTHIPVTDPVLHANLNSSNSKVLTKSVAPVSISSTSPHNYSITWSFDGQLEKTINVGSNVQVNGARYNGRLYSPIFSVSKISQIAPTESYPNGITQIVQSISDPNPTTPIITCTSTVGLAFPVESHTFGVISYVSDSAQTSLSLVGQGASMFNADTSWGNALQENLIHIVENFSSDVPPPAPLRGQLWFDDATDTLRVYTGIALPIINATKTSLIVDCRLTSVPSVGDVVVVFNNPSQHLISTEYVVQPGATEIATARTESGYASTIYVGKVDDSFTSLRSSDAACPFGLAYSKNAWIGLLTQGSSVPTVNTFSESVADAKYLNINGGTITGDIVLQKVANLLLNQGNINVTDGKLNIGKIGNSINLITQGTSAPALMFASSAATTPTGNEVINLGQNKIVNMSTPSNPSDAATKAYVDGLANGITWLQPMLDPNLFDDSLSTPPINPLAYTRSYIVGASPTGAWVGLTDRVVTWNGKIWIDILGRSIAIGDRFGVLISPANDELNSLPAPGGNLAGHAAQLATVVTVNPRSYSFYTPHEPDAISVTGKPKAASGNDTTYSPSFGHSYTFRGTWGNGSYGMNYQWIEFSGPQMLVDGAGLRYTGNVLNIGQGFGISVGADMIEVDTSVIATRSYVTQLIAPSVFYVTCSDETSTLMVGSSKSTFRVPYGVTLTQIRASVSVAPLGDQLSIDVQIGGVSIFSTPLTVDSNHKTSTTSRIPAILNTTSIADDTELTISVTSVGSTTAGAGLKLCFIGHLSL